MRRLIVAGTVALLASAAGVGAASAQDRPDRPDRSLRLDHDSMRNDYREDRLKIPAHPLFPEQPPPPSTAASKGKAKSKGSGAASR